MIFEHFVGFLTENSQQYIDMASAAGIPADITALSVLNNLNVILCTFVYAVWALDPLSIQKLKMFLVQSVQMNRSCKNWALSKTVEQRLILFAEKAVHDFINPNICSQCKGRKIISPRKKFSIPFICETCTGTGVKRQNQREMARILDVERNKWRRVWSPRYNNYFVKTLKTWESEAKIILNKGGILFDAP